MPTYQHLARVKKVCLERMYYHNRHLQQTHMKVENKLTKSQQKKKKNSIQNTIETKYVPEG